MTEPEQLDESASRPDVFRTTRWTQVLQARGDSPEAKSALSELCAAYYAPVFGFIRRDAPSEETARDLTQEFFRRMLASHGIAAVEPSRGRFRSFLLGAVKHFLADMRKHDHRQKRGAGQAPERLEPGTDTSFGPQLPDPKAPNPEHEFDRKWALTMLERALKVLASEQEVAGKTQQFDALKPWLTGEIQEISQAETARQLGLNEGAVKVAIYRLRRRFREVLKTEIGQTLSDPTQVDEELQCLLKALLTAT